MNSIENGTQLTAKIVRKYVGHHKLAANQLSDLITSIHQAIGQLGRPAAPEEVRTPAVSVRRSVQNDLVICLNCGYRGKTLRRHIRVRHGLSRDEYRRRWGLKSRSSAHGSSLFGAAVGNGEGTRARTQGSDRDGSARDASPGTGSGRGRG